MNSLHLVPNRLEESKRVFLAQKLSLFKLIHNFQIQVEHIGSTVIPNSLTKPVLDILLIVQTHEDQIKSIPFLLNSGYSQGELGKKQTKLFFYKQIKANTKIFIESIHVHLVCKNTPNQNDRVSILIRDYLMKHPEEVEAYNAEKKRLAITGNYDRSFYVLHKEPYMKKLVEKVLQQQAKT